MSLSESFELSWGDDVSERPSLDYSGRVEQEMLVEALVVDIEGNDIRFLITDVLKGVEKIGAYGDLMGSSTGHPAARWFRHLPQDFRELTEVAEAEIDETLPTYSDSLRLDYVTGEIHPGDTVHIHTDMYWVEHSEKSKHGYWKFEACRLPVENRDLQEFIAESAQRRKRLARLVARSMAHREYLDMQSRTQIQPNVPFRPFEDSANVRQAKSGRQEWLIVNGSYRGGPVNDHYVNVIAKPAADYLTEFGGERHFTVSGTEMLTPNIMPFGPGSPDDPLHEIEIEVKSTTVLNPAVGEQQLRLIIDGKHYDAVKDFDLSSHHFDRPGHRVIFGAYSDQERQFDTCVLTEEQSEAIRRRKMKDRTVGMHVLYRAIHQGRDFIAEEEALDQETDERLAQLRTLDDEIDDAIIGAIADNPLDTKMPSGAVLLIPKSMLDAVEIEFIAVSE